MLLYIFIDMIIVDINKDKFLGSHQWRSQEINEQVYQAMYKKLRNT